MVGQKPEIPGNYLPVERLVFNYQDLFAIIPARQMIVLSPLPISHSINGFLNRGSLSYIRGIHGIYFSLSKIGENPKGKWNMFPSIPARKIVIGDQ